MRASTTRVNCHPRQNSGFPGYGPACRAYCRHARPTPPHRRYAHDLPALARFCTPTLGWKVLSERENEVVIGIDENAAAGMCFMPVADPKTVKNRVHLDLTSSAADRDQENDGLLALGTRRVDIGQTGAESWTVVADP